NMLKLFLRFSQKQKLIMSFFFFAALAGTVLVFFVDHTLLIISLFWLLAVLVFVMIMLVRRLNAKITRVSPTRNHFAQLKKKIIKPTSRLDTNDSLEVLQKKYRKAPTVATALPLARSLIQQAGNITEAKKILTEIPADVDLHEAEISFIRRVNSLYKYLHVDYALPQRHNSYNFIPKRNQILYAVNMSPLSVTNGYTTRTHGVATGLVSQGLEVVVAPLPGKPWDKGPQSGSHVPKEHRRFVQKVNNVTYSHNPGIRAWQGDLDTFLQVSADAYVREAMIVKPEYIIAASNYLSALPALIAARRLGIPFVYEMRGFWEISAASVNPGWEQSDQYKLDRKFDLFLAEEADNVVVITDEMRNNLIARGISESKIYTAPNCVDIEKFAPLGKDLALLKRIGFVSPELPVIGFAGSVTSYEGLDYVVTALSQLKKEGAEFNFLIIGDGSFLPEIQAQVTKLGLDKYTRYVHGIDNAEMPVYLSCIDIFPIARKSLPVTELVSPIKPLEAMAVGGTV